MPIIHILMNLSRYFRDVLEILVIKYFVIFFAEIVSAWEFC